jgi:hypothetical protein
MLECNPEMVAVAFHGGIRFASPEVMHDLAAQDPEDLPPWSTLLAAVSLEPWAEELAKIILADPNGEQFLVVAACLEYLHGRSAISSQPAGGPATDDRGDATVDEGDSDDRPRSRRGRRRLARRAGFRSQGSSFREITDELSGTRDSGAADPRR